ncbi:ABC transporter permease [Desulforamulus aeronauticus]|uniref:Putative ABC transport system permease protein n=1 Tax=Desulforamulus aeronauticus DSM 10349 TaxID=1121421 RepID=A0A1M6VYS3_9FIRM|nr:ABC transporter permease [Desulforamulus aeronauticus]SHK86642.1 putative ABC transport system permease protein [Desulforamulus aeronauticus DSM 10349]
MNVANRKCIRGLSVKSMRAARSRNLIAILAIALTAVLFTSLFTVALSINDSFQQANFRQVGGWSHGGFKYLTLKQFEEIKNDPLIEQYGLRRFVGMPENAPFLKSHVEIGYSDINQAHWMYCDPVEGRLPTEDSKEAATDTRVLELLGVEPVLGNEFTMTFDVDGTEVTETFVLSGWWEYDEAIVANHVLIPHSRAQAIYDQVGIGSGIGNDGMTGSWNLDVMLGSSLHIKQDLSKILANHGYQTENSSAGDNYIPTGVNWGYTGSQLADNIDPITVVAIAGLLLIIIFTGYLIIYNVFQISVSNDIRFYGLLKTIGTTGRQIKRIIRQQALLLSLIGIPLGLLVGYGVGTRLTPVVLSRLNGVVQDTVSASPLIFIGSALFALVTVVISCRRPGRMAARVSPVEAVLYTEEMANKKTIRKAQSGASLPRMAWANLGRNRSKTAITVASLSLAVLLLNMTVTFINGFDMDKYLSKMAADFIVADAGYFQVGNMWSAERALPEEIITELEANPGIEAGGRVYGKSSPVEEFVTEDYYRAMYGAWNDQETLDNSVAVAQKNEAGLLADQVQLFGMERYALGKLQVLEGDLSKLHESGGRYVAAVYSDDDYGNPQMDSNWAKIGDTVTLRYVEEYEYYDPETGKILDPGNMLDDRPFRYRAKTYRDIDYEVAALITVPHSLSYRYYGADEFVMNDQTFIQDSGTSNIMYYACDVSDEGTADMETFLSDLTNEQMLQFDYESKSTYAAEFDSFRNMFLILGGVLSFIVGLVGVLNFLNAILTGILTRRREFAMLQSIGMTGNQLKTMLTWEGLYYALGAVTVSLLLSIAAGPLLSNVLASIFWFFTYRFTVLPILSIAPIFTVLGIAVPLMVYRTVSRQSIVERLRETE